MKMRLIVGVGIFTVALLIAVIMMCTKTIQIMQRVAVVKLVSGKVYVERFGLEGKRKELKKGMLVKTFDVVRTGDDGHVVLHWVDDFQIELKPKSVLRVLRSSFEKDKKTTTSLLFLEAGEAVTRFKRKLSPGSKFELRTPIVMAAVRGTEFSMQVCDDNSTIIKVYSGVVSIRIAPTGKEIELHKGNMAIIGAGGAYKVGGISELR